MKPIAPIFSRQNNQVVEKQKLPHLLDDTL
jgi:hypothetical protein